MLASSPAPDLLVASVFFGRRALALLRESPRPARPSAFATARVSALNPDQGRQVTGRVLPLRRRARRAALPPALNRTAARGAIQPPPGAPGAARHACAARSTRPRHDTHEPRGGTLRRGQGKAASAGGAAAAAAASSAAAPSCGAATAASRTSCTSACTKYAEKVAPALTASSVASAPRAPSPWPARERRRGLVGAAARAALRRSSAAPAGPRQGPRAPVARRGAGARARASAASTPARHCVESTSSARPPLAHRRERARRPARPRGPSPRRPPRSPAAWPSAARRRRRRRPPPRGGAPRVPLELEPRRVGDRALLALGVGRGEPREVRRLGRGRLLGRALWRPRPRRLALLVRGRLLGEPQPRRGRLLDQALRLRRGRRLLLDVPPRLVRGRLRGDALDLLRRGVVGELARLVRGRRVRELALRFRGRLRLGARGRPSPRPRARSASTASTARRWAAGARASETSPSSSCSSSAAAGGSSPPRPQTCRRRRRAWRRATPRASSRCCRFCVDRRRASCPASLWCAAGGPLAAADVRRGGDFLPSSAPTPEETRRDVRRRPSAARLDLRGHGAARPGWRGRWAGATPLAARPAAAARPTASAAQHGARSPRRPIARVALRARADAAFTQPRDWRPAGHGRASGRAGRAAHHAAAAEEAARRARAVAAAAPERAAACGGRGRRSSACPARARADAKRSPRAAARAAAPRAARARGRARGRVVLVHARRRRARRTTRQRGSSGCCARAPRVRARRLREPRPARRGARRRLLALSKVSKKMLPQVFISRRVREGRARRRRDRLGRRAAARGRAAAERGRSGRGRAALLRELRGGHRGGPAALYRPVATHRGARPGRDGRRHRHRAGDGGGVRAWSSPRAPRTRARWRDHESSCCGRGRGRFELTPVPDGRRGSCDLLAEPARPASGAGRQDGARSPRRASRAVPTEGMGVLNEHLHTACGCASRSDGLHGADSAAEETGRHHAHTERENEHDGHLRPPVAVQGPQRSRFVAPSPHLRGGLPVTMANPSTNRERRKHCHARLARLVVPVLIVVMLRFLAKAGHEHRGRDVHERQRAKPEEDALDGFAHFVSFTS